MACLAVSRVVVCGASASADSVRRALWLPRVPQGRSPLGSLVRQSTQPGPVAITQHAGYVLVHGHSALSWRREWLTLSADAGRVFAFCLLDLIPATCWALYENGRLTRAFDERTGREEGARRPFEPAPRRGAVPSEHVRALYRALTDQDVAEEMDLDAEVGVWFVESLPQRAAPGGRH